MKHTTRIEKEKRIVELMVRMYCRHKLHVAEMPPAYPNITTDPSEYVFIIYRGGIEIASVKKINRCGLSFCHLSPKDGKAN